MSFKIIETGFEGLRIIETKAFRDERGYFFETFNELKLRDIGIEHRFVQDNISKSKKGVLRGLHYQLDPKSQTKLLAVMSGRIIDVAVDLRKGSATFGKYYIIKLSSEECKMVLIPKGFAHGFVSLCDDTVILYKCDNYYSPEHERGIRFDDPELGIDWKLAAEELIVAERDRKFPNFKEAEMNFNFGN